MICGIFLSFRSIQDGKIRICTGLTIRGSDMAGEYSKMLVLLNNRNAVNTHFDFTRDMSSSRLIVSMTLS